jgi:hypothetical protein
VTRKFAAVIALLGLVACHGRDPGASWLDPATEVATPAGDGSRFPNLAGGPAAPLVMSWLEPAADGGFALRYSTWSGGSWTGPRTVAEGRDWFINWADFPSVVPVNRRVWGAHWLQQKPGDVYAYDVRIAVSTDAGNTWSAPMSPHDDGTPTEHGFVSLFGLGESLQTVWLDGRHTSGEHEHGGGAAGAMTLRSAGIGTDGRLLGPDLEVDARVCDCCQTDATLTRDGPVVAYRDRSENETRDIILVRRTSVGWSDPVHVASDGWKIEACPVNGPAVDARGDTVVVAWFTAPDVPRVRLAYSGDGGRSFAAPIEVATGRVAGRVDVVLLPDGRAVVSWLADVAGAAEIRAQPFTRDGPAGEATVIVRADVARSSGFPQMALTDGALLFTWTQSGEPPRVRAAIARLR